LFESCLATTRNRKTVTIVIYRVDHGYSATHFANRVNVRASTIKKYFDIMIDVLPNINKLFSKYIKFLLENICNRLEILLRSAKFLLNICEAIGGTHFPFVEHPSKKMTLTMNDFYNKKKFHNIIVQVMCKQNILECMCRPTYRSS